MRLSGEQADIHPVKSFFLYYPVGQTQVPLELLDPVGHEAAHFTPERSITSPVAQAFTQVVPAKFKNCPVGHAADAVQVEKSNAL